MPQTAIWRSAKPLWQRWARWAERSMAAISNYALLPVTHVILVDTALEWATLGAIPETFGTAWGSLVELRLTSGDSVLIHGGTSSVGIAASTIARDRGVTVFATTRQEAKRAVLEANGADHVLSMTAPSPHRCARSLPAESRVCMSWSVLPRCWTRSTMLRRRASLHRRVPRGRMGARARPDRGAVTRRSARGLQQQRHQPCQLWPGRPGHHPRRRGGTLPRQYRSHIRARRDPRCPSLHGDQPSGRQARRPDARRLTSAAIIGHSTARPPAPRSPAG